MSEDTDTLAAKEAQRTQARQATLEMMRAKKRRPKTFTSELEGEQVSWEFKAIGNLAYDKLLTECPPTTVQRAEGATYDQDKFAPELLSRVCTGPSLTVAEWSEIWKSPDWSRGEVGELFWTAVSLCGQGLTLTPTEAG